jgi:hypothetical protein
MSVCSATRPTVFSSFRQQGCLEHSLAPCRRFQSFLRAAPRISNRVVIRRACAFGFLSNGAVVDGRCRFSSCAVVLSVCLHSTPRMLRVDRGSCVPNQPPSAIPSTQSLSNRVFGDSVGLSVCRPEFARLFAQCEVARVRRRPSSPSLRACSESAGLVIRHPMSGLFPEASLPFLSRRSRASRRARSWTESGAVLPTVRFRGRPKCVSNALDRAT